MLVVDPDGIHAAREALRIALGRALEPEWRAAYARTQANRYE
jgi:aminopeptidase N